MKFRIYLPVQSQAFYIFGGLSLDSPVIINVCKDVLDGYIVSRGPAMSFLAVSSKRDEWLNADIKIVQGGKWEV